MCKFRSKVFEFKARKITIQTIELKKSPLGPPLFISEAVIWDLRPNKVGK
jgi:hypothetical protein